MRAAAAAELISRASQYAAHDQMEIHKLVERAQSLSDLELATLLCLIAKQHCCIEVEDELVDDLAQELALVGSMSCLPASI